MGIGDAARRLQENQGAKLVALRNSIPTIDSGGLLLPEEVDLTKLTAMADEELVSTIEKSFTAIGALESQIFRHAVMMAAALRVLEERARQEIGEVFRKKEWLKGLLEERFGGRIGVRTALLYQQVAKPEYQEEAMVFASKIETLRSLRSSHSGSDLVAAAIARGIKPEEVENLPDSFSLRAFRSLVISKRKDEGRSYRPKPQRVTITVDAPEELASHLELAVRSAVAEFLEMSDAEKFTTSKDRESTRGGNVKRVFAYPPRQLQ